MIDVLDHVLDKGIVIDAWVRVSLMGLHLVTVEARIVVASFQTYLEHAGAIARALPLPIVSSVPVPSIGKIEDGRHARAPSSKMRRLKKTIDRPSR